MDTGSRPPIRNCPVCGLTMLASRSRQDAADFDTFHCLTCHTTITQSRPPRPAGQDG